MSIKVHHSNFNLIIKKIALICFCIISLTKHSIGQINHSAPKLYSGQFSGAALEWKAQLDLVTYGSASTFTQLKAINPDLITFTSRDWNAWEIGDDLPSEWIHRDSCGNQVSISYSSKYMDISNYCGTSSDYGNKKYNEYLIDDTVERVDANDVFDGFKCQGLWDRPYGGTAISNIDINEDALNDWNNGGESWIRSTLRDGINSFLPQLYNLFKNRGKYLLINSGHFHDWGWGTHNGFLQEHINEPVNFDHYSDRASDFRNAVSPPHFIVWNCRIPDVANLREVRSLLTFAVVNDMYISITDEVGYGTHEHKYFKYFDEYDTDLGTITSNMIKMMDDVCCRFYDNGVAICNWSGENQTVTDMDLQNYGGSSYNGPYYRFRGNQDVVVNNGEAFDSIELFGDRDGYLEFADGIILLKNPQTVICSIIVDHEYASTTSPSSVATLNGAWLETSTVSNAWYAGEWDNQGMLRTAYKSSGDGNAKATFVPTINTEGFFEIFEWHGKLIGLNEATNTPAKIYYNGGNSSDDIIIDQSESKAGHWNSLGVYKFDIGTGNKVIINDGANGYVIADAFKFVFKGTEQDSIPPNEPRNFGSLERTDHSIRLGWDPPVEASDGDVADHYEIYRNGGLIANPSVTTYLDNGLLENTIYDYSVYAVDNACNRSSSAATGSFSTQPDITPPFIENIKALNPTLVAIIFNEALDQITAEDENNYTIDNNITIESAILQEILNTVNLQTSKHVIGQTYTIVINNIQDRASTPNTIVSNSSDTYIGVGDSISIAISVDNEYELYVNGSFIGSDNAWENAEQYTVPSILGKNVIAVKGIDAGDFAGLVAEIDFSGSLMVSDGNWNISTTLVSNWETVSFDDALWSNASSYGLHGVATPWANYTDVAGISTSNGVQWIWSSDNDNDNMVYFRFSFNGVGDTTGTSVISVSPASLLFTATEGGENPSNQTITITNAGGGTISWTATEYPSVDWLNLSNTSGGSGDQTTVSINISGLATGTYNDVIRIGDPNASNNPVDVPVTLSINPIPTDGIILTSPNGGEIWHVSTNHSIQWTTQNFNNDVEIEYSTTSGISWNSIDTSTANEGSYSWTIPNDTSSNCLVRVSDASDGDPSDVSDSVFTICVFTETIFEFEAESSPYLPNSGWEIIVNEGENCIKSLIRCADEIGPVEDYRIDYTFNVPSGVDNVYAFGEVDVDNSWSHDSFWIKLNSSDQCKWNGICSVMDDGWGCVWIFHEGHDTRHEFAVSEGTNTLSVYPRDAGTHLNWLVITTDSTTDINNYQFNANPLISINPSYLSFTATVGDSNISPQTLDVNNAGGGILTWTAVEHPEVGWLELSDTTGGTNDTINVAVDISGLPDGTYMDTVSIIDPNATNSPVSIPITLIVNLESSETIFEFEAESSQFLPNSGWEIIVNEGENCIKSLKRCADEIGPVEDYRIDYTFNVPSGVDNVYVFGEVDVDNSWSHDSFWIKMNSSDLCKWNRICNIMDDGWGRVWIYHEGHDTRHEFAVSEGTNALSVYPRDAGTYLNWLVITIDSTVDIENYEFGQGNTPKKIIQDEQESVKVLPCEFSLSQNYPNPFNPETRISYQLSEDANVKLEIYDIQGKKVKTLIIGDICAGYHLVLWNGLNDLDQKISSGIYLYKIKAIGATQVFIETRKMIMMK